MPSSPLPDAPRFDPTSAHVDLGAASHVVGATALSVNRALSGATSQLTACYRAALPKAVGPVDGTAMLHVETDGAGVITDAQLSTALGTRFAQCAAMAVTGRRISNVDTGNARADIPVVLRPH
jgi:hypothetical protein